MSKNAGAFLGMTGRTLCTVVDPLGEGARRPLWPHDVIERSERERGPAAAMQRHQEQWRADTSALVDAARGQSGSYTGWSYAHGRSGLAISID